MSRSPLIHPILFALFPLAFLAVQNSGEWWFGDLLRPMLAAVVLALLVFAVARLLLHNSEKAGLAASLFVLLFFSYGHLLRLVKRDIGSGFIGLDAKLSTILILLLVLIVGCVLLALTRKQLRKLTGALNLIAAGLLLIQIVQGGYALARTDQPQVTVPPPDTTLSLPQPPPDIYYLVFDAFGRADVLQGIYGYDAQWFVEHLQRKGFYVASKSHSNYCQTALSLSATLNMNYVDSLGSFNPGSWDRRPLNQFIHENRAFKSLRELGYHFTAFSTSFPPTEFRNADRYVSSAAYMNEFEITVVGSTPLPLLLRGIFSEYSQHRQRINDTFEGLATLDLGDRPNLIFAHLVAPHTPFVFTATGGETQPDRPFFTGDGNHFYEKGGTPAEYIEGYHEQVAYVATRIRQMVDHILARYDNNPPIIIIQGDHGPGSRLYWQNVRKTDVRERFSILNAIYLPDQADSILYPSISSVNTFRVIFDHYFGGDYELLPDRSIYTGWTRPYLFFDVTNELCVIDGIETPPTSE